MEVRRSAPANLAATRAYIAPEGTEYPADLKALSHAPWIDLGRPVRDITVYDESVQQHLETDQSGLGPAGAERHTITIDACFSLDLEPVLWAGRRSRGRNAIVFLFEAENGQTDMLALRDAVVRNDYGDCATIEAERKQRDPELTILFGPIPMKA